MGIRRRAAIRRWARGIVRHHGAAVADVLGVEPRWVHLSVSAADGVAVTVGRFIVLHEPWFAEHPDDAGCVVHELSHAYLRPHRPPDDVVWLIEGIADLTRNRVGLGRGPSPDDHEPGRALVGYQPSAQFLAWVEAGSPGTVRALAGRLRTATYDAERFDVEGTSLRELVEAYEREHARERRPGERRSL